MKTKLSNIHISIVLVLFALTFWAIQSSGSVTETPIKKSLSEFPKQIGDFKYVDNIYFSDGIINMLGVDDYISYDYVGKNGRRVNLYVSYFGAVGVTGSYHSPKNCLPGGGWNVIHSESIALKNSMNGGSRGKIQKVIIQKGDEQQVVLYWFHNRGRIIASEYWEKIYLVLDALFKGRRDGSFIRIMGDTQKGDTGASVDELIDFAGNVATVLDDFIPGS